MKDKSLYIFSHIHKCAGSTINKHIRNNFSENEYLYVHLDDESDKRGLWWDNSKIDKSLIKADQFIAEASEEKKTPVRVIFGHDVYFGIDKHFQGNPFYFTFIRDPIARAASMYTFLRNVVERRFDQGKDHPSWARSVVGKNKAVFSFAQWIENLPDNYNRTVFHFSEVFGSMNLKFSEMTQYHVTKAKQMLKHFYFIGHIENKDDFTYIFNKLKIRTLLSNSNVSMKNRVTKQELKEVRKLLEPKISLDLDLYEYARSLSQKK